MIQIEWFPVNNSLQFGHGGVYEYRVRSNMNGTAVLIANGPPCDDGEPTSRREECESKEAAMLLAQAWEDEANDDAAAAS